MNRIKIVAREFEMRRRWRRKGIFVAAGSRVHPQVEIGAFTRINAASDIAPCSIGSHCAIGGRLVVRSQNHHLNFPNMNGWVQREIVRSSVRVTGEDRGEVVIGHGCWIGDSVIILPGVRVGNGAVIGAGSVVTKSVPDFGVAVGVPAKVVRFRFSPEVIAMLSVNPWWNWTVDQMRARREFFETDLSGLSSMELRAWESRLLAWRTEG